MTNNLTLEGTLARSITRAASQQANYTIRFLVDPERVEDAYCAYAYFRWVDDIVDADLGLTELKGFLEWQRSLLDRCYQSEPSQNSTATEKMLTQLIQHDHEKNSGLQIYLRNMMKVMEFDVNRRGRLISQVELDQYTHCLASAVTEAMHYFIGHGCYSPCNDDTRYLAVTGAHIAHMLRDAYEDLQAGYYNIPSEVLEAGCIQPHDIQSNTYRAWVQSRVQLARKYFNAGREYIAQVENARCRLAGFAYMARFEWLLDTIELEGCILRRGYGERKSLGAKYQMGTLALSSMINARSRHPVPQHAFSRLWRKP